ncbi:MAG TPA: hypothetical protein VMV58_00215 [Desulfosporosinus sp.]|nr:hypothetical protein [Desulfosporosinus sp.]
MAFEGSLTCIPGMKAGENLSSSQFLFGKINTAGDVVKLTTAGAYPSGVIQNDPISGSEVAIACAGVTKVVCGASVTAGSRVMSNALGKAITAASGASAATKDSTIGPFNMAAADTMVIDVDNASNATATFDATTSTVTDTTTYPVTDQDGLTEVVTIDGGAAQTVTFTGAHTTAAHIIASMNAQLTGCSVAASTTHVKITTDTKGTGSSVLIGTGTCALTWDTVVAGTGDVVSIDAVTAAEVKTVVEADTTADVVVNTDGSFTINSPTTGPTSELDFKSGNALTIFGFSVEVIIGLVSGNYSAGIALLSGAVNEYISVVLEGPTRIG